MTDTTKPDACREEFEAWALGKGIAYRSRQQGLVFNDVGAQTPSWTAWQAAWNARAPVAAPSGAIGYINAGWMEHRKGVTRIHPEPYPRVATLPVYAEPVAPQSEDKRDAERYRWLRDNKHLDGWWSIGGPKDRCDNIDADIDAARSGTGDKA